MSVHAAAGKVSYETVIDQICEFDWDNLDRQALMDVAWAYYFFSVQFRENLKIARKLYPNDAQLIELEHGECNTDNLSPWPGVAAKGERMNHDEFMRRALTLTAIPERARRRLEAIGGTYLESVRGMDDMTRALSIASYEDGGLERVFGAILRAGDWNDPMLEAFKHFLVEHIRFDSDPDHGHGALCRHLTPDARVVPLWAAFRDILFEAATGSSAAATGRKGTRKQKLESAGLASA